MGKILETPIGLRSKIFLLPPPATFNHTYLAAGSSYAISFRYMNNGSTAGAAAERGQLELRCTFTII